LEQVFQDCQRDVEKALDTLLNATYLEEEFSVGYHLSSSEFATLKTTKAVLLPKKEHSVLDTRTVKAKSVKHVKYTVQGCSESQSTSNRKQGNAWGRIGNDVDAICDIFPSVHVSRIGSLYHQLGSKEKVVQYLVNDAPLQTAHTVFNEENVRDLSQLFPFHHPYEVEMALAQSSSFEAAVDQLLSQEPRTNGTSPTPPTPTPTVCAPWKIVRGGKAVKEHETDGGSNSFSSSSSTVKGDSSSDTSSVLSGSTINSSRPQKVSTDGWMYFLEQAEKYRDKRNQIYRKAATALRQGNRNHLNGKTGAIAAVYVDEVFALAIVCLCRF
jgi:hypothetical protein